MQDLMIEQTQSTPFISFSGETNRLTLKGESFPENAAKFYAPVMEWIREYLDQPEEEHTVVEFEIVYFNSSTSKVYMTIFDMMEAAVAKGKNLTVIWKCDHENETAIECGEEFKEDLGNLPFEIVLK